MKRNNKKILRYFKTKSGKVPFLEWFDGIKDPVIKHRIRSRLDRVEMGNFGDFKTLDGGISELRLFFGAGYRIYFGEEGDVFVILLCGGDKKSQKKSQKKDIETAKAYWKNLQERTDE